MPVVPPSENVYFTADEGRVTDATFAGMSDGEVADARNEVEDEIENSLCPGYAFVPRTNTVTLSGSGYISLFLPHLYVRTVTAVRTWTYDPEEYTDLTAPELADITVSETGAIRRATLGYWPAGYENVTVTYTYGMDAPPARVKRAALILFRYRLLEGFAPQPANVTREQVGPDAISYNNNPGGGHDIVGNLLDEYSGIVVLA